MSPRKPAALRGGGHPDLREHLIATAARMIAEGSGTGLAVRDIARQARVADGVLYNYFEDKDDLLARALLAHVAGVMAAGQNVPRAGTGTVAGNLREFINSGIQALSQVAPAFAGVFGQPGVLSRFHAMVGGAAAFSADVAPGSRRDGHPGRREPRGLPDILRGYLRDEQQAGRVDQAADIEAAVALIVGMIHGEVLPRVVFRLPGGLTADTDLAQRVADTVLHGIAPRRPA